MTNTETGHLFLNAEAELPESRVVIEKGAMWEYSNTDEQESIQTTGPLKYGVLLMVSPPTPENASLRHLKPCSEMCSGERSFDFLMGWQKHLIVFVR